MTDEKRARLAELDEQIERMRAELGDPTPDDPMDFGDAGQNLEMREQQQGMIESLEDERTRLKDELGES